MAIRPCLSGLLSGWPICQPLQSAIIWSEEHRFFVAEQLQEIDAMSKIILGPMGQKTAPAAALAALLEKKMPLEIIDLQSGSSLGENDMVRLSDMYGQKNHDNQS